MVNLAIQVGNFMLTAPLEHREGSTDAPYPPPPSSMGDDLSQGGSEFEDNGYEEGGESGGDDDGEMVLDDEDFEVVGIFPRPGNVLRKGESVMRMWRA